MPHRLVRLTVLLIIIAATSGCATREVNATKGAVAGALIGGTIGFIGGPPGIVVGAGAGAAAGAALGASQPTDDDYGSIVINNTVAPLPQPMAPMLAFVWSNDARIGEELRTTLEGRGWVIHRGSKRPPEARFFAGERMLDGTVLVTTSDMNGTSGQALGRTTEEAASWALQRFGR